MNIRKKISGWAMLAGLICAAPAMSSVLIDGTRLIYPSNKSQQSISLNNPDDKPSVMQVWVDSGDADSTPETADAPFVVTPPVFRIDPKVSQSVRIVFVGQEVAKEWPQDQEKVFYLNTLQIPAVDPANADQNQMLLLLRNRIKLFYRPSTLTGDVGQVASQLQFSVNQLGPDWQISAKNDTGYYVSLYAGSVVNGTSKHEFHPAMVAPKSVQSWVIPQPKEALRFPLTVEYHYVNDFGAMLSGKATVPAPVTGKK